MTLVVSAIVSAVFASSVRLLLSRDLVRMSIGVSLLSSAINLFVMFAGLTRGAAPIHPVPDGPLSDPIVQALTLTSIVIGGGVTLLVLGLLYRIAVTDGTVDAEDLERQEVSRESSLERTAEW